MVHDLRAIGFRRTEMTKDSEAKQPNADAMHLVTQKQRAEQRRFDEALEDDEVREALKSLHAEPRAKATPGKSS
jgi:hypothetical protein